MDVIDISGQRTVCMCRKVSAASFRHFEVVDIDFGLFNPAQFIRQPNLFAGVENRER